MEVCSRGGEVAFKRSEQDLVAMELRETLCLSFSLCRVKWDVLDCFGGGGGMGFEASQESSRGTSTLKLRIAVALVNGEERRE